MSNQTNHNYEASNISVLEGLEAVFKRPGMYIGSTDENGVQHCLVEIIDNSVDEHNAGVCDHIKVKLFKDGSVSVTDNGRGIPVGIHPVYNVPAATLAVTELHAGGKFGGENSSYHRTGGLHGVGASVVNALSEWFEMTIYRDNNIYFQRFELVFDEANKKFLPAQAVAPLSILEENISEQDAKEKFGFLGKTGTKIKFKLYQEKFSSKVFNEETDEYEVEYYHFDADRIEKKLELLSFLNPSLRLTFINEEPKHLTQQQIKDITTSCTESYKNLPAIFVVGEGDELFLTDENKQILGLNNEHHAYSALVEEYSVCKPKRMVLLLDNAEFVAIDKEWCADQVVEYLSTINSDMKEPVVEPLYFEKEVAPKKGSDKGDIFVRVAFQWYSGDKVKINGFVNNIHTPLGGTHITGYKKAITKSINNYVKNFGTDKEKNEFNDVSSEDMTEGVIAMVSVKVSEPLFEGQTKEKLSTKEADSAVYFATTEYLSRMFEENPKIAKAVVERVLKAKKAREAAQRAREASITDKKTIGFSTPAKLADCQSKDPSMCELFLVEGDSAGGSAKMARDKKFQAVLPLKGKILNTQKREIGKILANDEVNALISALGCGVGKNFDITKLRYHKIIYMTDADVDGQHIRVLLSTFFNRLFPELLQNQHIYTAIPPLYRVKKKTGKDESYYLKDDEALENFKKQHNIAQWDVSRFKGLGEMNPEQLKETTMSLETRELGLIEYSEEYEGEIDKVFEMLMGDDPDCRKQFIETHSLET